MPNKHRVGSGLDSRAWAYRRLHLGLYGMGAVAVLDKGGACDAAAGQLGGMGIVIPLAAQILC